MNKLVVVLVLTSFSTLQAMQQFTAQDRQGVRIAVAKYLFRKANDVPLPDDEEKIKQLPIFQSLKQKRIVHDFTTNSAILEDDQKSRRYQVHLFSKEVKEITASKK